MSLADNIVRALGIEPEQLRQAMTRVITDAATVKTEVLGAKSGFQAGAKELFTRLDRIEENQRAIMRALQIPERDIPHDETGATQIPGSIQTLAKINGGSHDG